MGLKDDTSACQADVEVRLTCCQQTEHASVACVEFLQLHLERKTGRSFQMENQWNQWHLWICMAAAAACCLLFIYPSRSLRTRVDV